MRVGTNPLAGASVPAMPAVVAAVITHLPSRTGYHAGRFEVIRACFESLGRDLPLYVWDNGSDPEFREWLQSALRPEFLTLSPNTGKATARTAILRTFPPKTVVCLSDDDIYFEAGWLEPQLALLEGFPNVGQVSGCPIRTQARYGIESTLRWAKEHARVEAGRFIPEEWEIDFCRSIGRDWLHHYMDTMSDQDYRICYQGLQAYAQAHHMQFIGYAGALERIGLWTDQAMRAELPFELTVDRLGLLRLTTTERLALHMGNVLEEQYADLRVRLS